MRTCMYKYSAVYLLVHYITFEAGSALDASNRSIEECKFNKNRQCSAKCGAR